ncbi:hypothetical protein [Streptomyces sp. H27-D2]|uniref:hypothetical protein n=1 Tax=Streptomyces sp. H27-D2 TaxID=3046304 RepID=UPI002DBDCD52|nr:hypothetical protein [Streptomyces sp. H27-D2]MEC4019349.1 hypothetical protein [Streptomyces sp. H27-D2]
MFTLAQLLLVVPGTGLGWDETVYTSQVSENAPAAFFSAPRARGISYLVAPVAALTSSTVVLRIYLALLSGAGLFAALWVWRRLLPVRVLATAGALFGSLWITLYYAPQVMPNLWSAYGTLLAVGCFLRAARDRTDHRALAGIAVGVAVVALMRPPDALWLALPLAAALLLVRRWRRAALLVWLAGGLALGAAEWVIEAYVRYGGLAARLHRASEIQGGMGWHWAVDDQMRSLDGYALCRPCAVPWRSPVTALWWFALPLLALGGTLAAARARRSATAVLPILTAAAMAVPYLFLIDYAAPRFLLPSYALLAIPVADCFWRGVADPLRRLRQGNALLVILALTGHLVVQYTVLTDKTAKTRALSQEFSEVATRLNQLGVRAPCIVSGDYAVQIAFSSGCSSRQTAGPDASITQAGVAAAARREPVAVIVLPGERPPGYARAWRSAPLPESTRFRGHRAYLSSTVPAP